MHEHGVATALTIAGSDSSGGAGIQADLKTFTALGVYGMSAITALTAQNTRGVSNIFPVSRAFVAEQIDQICQDLPVDGVKTGMLFSVEIIEAVADAVKRHGFKNLIVDPVMIAKSGDVLLQESARETMKSQLLPLAHVLTPNIPEAEALTGMQIDDADSMREAADRLRDMGPSYVLIKGGHGTGSDVVDYLLDGGEMREYRGPRVDTKNTHGTGCTFSAAIAACLAKGQSVEQAVPHAKEFIHGAIVNSLALGGGHGPLDHMWRIRGA